MPYYRIQTLHLAFLHILHGTNSCSSLHLTLCSTFEPQTKILHPLVFHITTLKLILTLLHSPFWGTRLHFGLFHTLCRIQGTAVAHWLRCCATNRKVAGSIPDGVTGIFHWHNPSDRAMALGSTQTLTEMSTRSISWGWKKTAGA